MKPISLFIILFGVLPFTACKEKDSGTVKPKGTSSEFVFHKEGDLMLYSDSVLIKKLDMELAEDDAERAQGLMNRPWMEESQCMLFIMDKEERQSFWMRNTIIPLDIIFINADMQIVSIAKDTQPYSEKSIPSAGPAKYVLEVVAGFSDKYGLKAGDRVEYKRINSI
jgi:uncharacterized membrane protein (UPF0127 family)